MVMEESVLTTMNVCSLVSNVPWNSMLALIPVALAYFIVWIARLRLLGSIRYPLVAALSAAWLAFLPNTCYLLTQWRHFLNLVDSRDLFMRAHADSVLLVELVGLSVFYFLYSGFGMLTFALAIRPIERFAISKGAHTLFWAAPFFVALSTGAYLGLVLRFNSWDFAARPGAVWSAITEVGSRPTLAAFIVAFGIFLWISYEAIDVWIDGLTDRWTRRMGKRIHQGPR